MDDTIINVNDLPVAVPVSGARPISFAVPVSEARPISFAVPVSGAHPINNYNSQGLGLAGLQQQQHETNANYNSGILSDFVKQINLDLCLLSKTFEEKNNIEPDSLITEAIDKIKSLKIPCDENKIQEIISKIIYITNLNIIPKLDSLNVLSSKLISQIQKNINFYKDLVDKIKKTNPNINLEEVEKYDEVLNILKNVLLQMPSLNQSQNKGEGSGEGIGSIGKVESVEYIIETLLLILTGSQIILGGKKGRRGTRKGKKNKRSKNAFKKSRKKRNSRKGKKLIK